MVNGCCVKEVESQWITFFIVMWLPLYGVLSLLALVCHGLCLEVLSNYLLIGGRLEGRGVL
jgi:hypothetical protein